MNSQPSVKEGSCSTNKATIVEILHATETQLFLLISSYVKCLSFKCMLIENEIFNNVFSKRMGGSRSLCHDQKNRKKQLIEKEDKKLPD